MQAPEFEVETIYHPVEAIDAHAHQHPPPRLQPRRCWHQFDNNLYFVQYADYRWPSR